jgi:hypothetical protein
VRARAGALAAALLFFTAASLAEAISVQSGELRISVFAQMKPYELPRTETAPIAVSLAGRLQSVHGGVPPQLRAMRIEVNRHGLLQSRGLATCPLRRLAAAPSAKAREECPDALIGAGRFWAHIVLPDQGAYPTRGELLIFNGRRRGHPVLFAHIYTSNPFDSAFTITFSIRHIAEGRYGTELQASLPEALGSWGYVDRIKLNLKREYSYKGKRRSYFSASCPAPQGTTRTAFVLARATLAFAEQSLTTTISKSCGVRG